MIKELIGKKVTCVNTGETVKGIITDIYEDEDFIGVRITHEPLHGIKYTGVTTLLSKSRKASALMPASEGTFGYINNDQDDYERKKNTYKL